MALNKLPLDTWVVVDVALDAGNVISAHGSQRRLNATNVTRRRYSASRLSPQRSAWAAHAGKESDRHASENRDVGVCLWQLDCSQEAHSAVEYSHNRPR